MQYSIIVPTLNPGSLWEEWIAEIEMQSIEPLAVYVIDSGSVDNSVAMSIDAEFAVTKIDRGEFNHGGTRQKALSLVGNAEYVIFLTQDAILADSDAIKRILAPFLDKDIAAVCGRQLPNLEAGVIARHARLFNYPEQSSVREFNERVNLGLKVAFLSNSFAAYRVSALLEVGGFPDDVIFGEDMYVAAKLLKIGRKIAYASDACVYHSHNYSIWQEFKRYFDMGVFHAREPWLREEFGAAEGEGMKFVVSEFKYLLRHSFWRIPESMLRTLLRYIGFRLGLMEKWLPLWVKRQFAMNKGYF